MEMNLVMQYVSYLMIAIGVMAFLVSVVTQVVKELPGLNKLPTSVVVLALSQVLCLLALAALMDWQKQPITWYMYFGCFFAAFIVALVSMGGWEKVREVWDRTKYNKQ